jgi:hypothetical protein
MKRMHIFIAVIYTLVGIVSTILVNKTIDTYNGKIQAAYQEGVVEGTLSADEYWKMVMEQEQ